MRSFVGFLTGVFLLEIAKYADGHGMMLDPVGRASRWRYNSSAPPNYDDAGLYCGGYWTQWGLNDGRCGLCGDNYNSPTPRTHEIGGKYGEGIVVKKYSNAQSIRVGVMITTNHKGYFYFNLCNLDEFGVESDECFDEHPLKISDGTDRLYIGTQSGWVNETILLPEGISCEHCVLRWTYYTGNNWGQCEDGTSAVGCGPQENFRSCADVSIDNSGLHRSRELETDDDEINEFASNGVEDNSMENEIPSEEDIREANDLRNKLLNILMGNGRIRNDDHENFEEDTDWDESEVSFLEKTVVPFEEFDEEEPEIELLVDGDSSIETELTDNLKITLSRDPAVSVNSV